ncbi:MAG: penicillin-binding transpeptidase domain-containing protein, partial [Pseudomonadota bacterium]
EPDSIAHDEPIRIKGWSPKNYSDSFRGEVTLSTALAKSINTVAVRLSERVGRERVRDLGAAMGLTSPIAEGPAVALGVSEATLLEMTSAYAVIANGGETAPAQGIMDITLRGDDQPVMTAGDGAATRRVMSEASAARLTGMMQAVIREGTGTRADPGRPTAGKTGTTQGARDAWFIGFTGQYVIGVWMGKDDNAPLVGVTGGGLPAAIWREVAVRVHDGLPVKALKTRSDGGGRELVATREGGGGDDVANSILRNVVDFLSSREGDAPSANSQGGDRIER